MTVTSPTTPTAPPIAAPHPLDPLSAAEIDLATSIARRRLQLPPRYRFPVVALKEPSKVVVAAYESGAEIMREVELTMLDNATGQTAEATVCLNNETLYDHREIPHVQPRLTADEVMECEAAVKASPEFQEALKKRGITNLDLVMIDPWAIGHYGFPEEEGLRLSKGLCWLRSSPRDNAYAHPIDGLIPVVDLNTMTVLRVEDLGIVPVPPEDGNYAAEFIPELRRDLKPLEIKQPEGVSFTVQGYQVSWQNWQMRIGWTPREGVVLHTIGYEDQGKLRPIIYRASLAEMVVPYGDPRQQHFRKNAFDVGEHGVGSLANSLTLGCDCLGEIYYFDMAIPNSYGEAEVIKNAVCMHEEDYGILWQYQNPETGKRETRRSRRLVISFVATVDNYEYGFFWYFYQDGSIQYEVKLTGILLCGALAATPDYGTLVAPELNAINHQHFFCMRLDMQIDGDRNSIYEVNTQASATQAELQATLLKTEQEAQRLIDPLVGRSWQVVNPHVLNSWGQPVGYKLVTGENILPFAQDDASIIDRAKFMTKHLWVTPYDQKERYAAGEYPNQHPGGEGLPQWTQTNRRIEDTNIVVWYNFGHHHIPRPEDWSVMPAAYIGFKLLPVGFFDQNPALDLPAP
ncbi:MAG: primary-amine oxidase [Coleofasciculaceae cyanobacterium SM2_1_6]|nr:primary-amine oxidase [Coleofasciculaceae cyanobacterium SM2_1_6]